MLKYDYQKIIVYEIFYIPYQKRTYKVKNIYYIYFSITLILLNKYRLMTDMWKHNIN